MWFRWLLIPLVLVLAAAMTSEVPYPKLSALPFSKWQSLLYTAVILFAAMIYKYNFETAMASVLLLFLTAGPLYCLSLKREEEPEPVSSETRGG